MTTTKRVLELRKANPRIRAIEISRIVGVSRERVSQILGKHGQPTRVNPDPSEVFWLAMEYKAPARGRPREYNQEEIWQAHLITGYGSTKLAKLYCISKTLAKAILQAKRRGENADK